MIQCVILSEGRSPESKDLQFAYGRARGASFECPKITHSSAESNQTQERKSVILSKAKDPQFQQHQIPDAPPQKQHLSSLYL
jgi:hypothetical protein